MAAVNKLQYSSGTLFQFWVLAESLNSIIGTVIT